MCLVMLLNQTLGCGKLMCSSFRAFYIPGFDLGVRGLGLEIDFINNTYIVLGMLFNFSGFDYFVCKKGIFCLSHNIAESASYNILCTITLKNLQFRSLMSDSLQPHGLAAGQASLSIINSWSLLKLISIESVMPSNHLILCHPLLLLLSIFPSIRVFSSESVLIRWPKYWSFSFSISPSNE